MPSYQFLTMGRPSVLIIGSTGTIGYHITRSFLSKCQLEDFRRVAVLTSEKTRNTKENVIQEYRQGGVEIILGDISNDAQMSGIFQGRVGQCPRNLTKECPMLSWIDPQPSMSSYPVWGGTYCTSSLTSQTSLLVFPLFRGTSCAASIPQSMGQI